MAMFRNVTSIFTAAVFLGVPAFADENDFPIELLHSYDANALEVNVPCVEQAVRDYLGGNLSEFNSETGLIFGENDKINVLVILSGERAESDLAYIDGVAINQQSGHLSINHSGLNGSFMTVSSMNESNLIPMEYNIQNFEAYIQSCRPAALLS